MDAITLHCAVRSRCPLHCKRESLRRVIGFRRSARVVVTT